MLPGAGAWCLVPGAWCLVPDAWCLGNGDWGPGQGRGTGDPGGHRRAGAARDEAASGSPERSEGSRAAVRPVQSTAGQRLCRNRVRPAAVVWMSGIGEGSRAAARPVQSTAGQRCAGSGATRRVGVDIRHRRGFPRRRPPGAEFCRSAAEPESGATRRGGVDVRHRRGILRFAQGDIRWRDSTLREELSSQPDERRPA
jgi:hypothetical protein